MNIHLMHSEFNELTIAPTFKDLLRAIVDERRNNIKNSDFYKLLEKAIRAKCEKYAQEFKTEIEIRDLQKCLCSDEFLKTMTDKHTPLVLMDTIRCICINLGLEFKDGIISWR